MAGVGRGAGVRLGSRRYFDPTNSLSGLDRWYDASDISTLWQESVRSTQVTTDTDPVGAWDDKSGNGENAVQATGANIPTYSSTDGILFDGSNDNLAWSTAFSSTGLGSFVFVVDLNDVADARHYAGGLAAISTTALEVLEIPATVTLTAADAITNAYHILEIYRTAAGVFTVYVNGVDVTSGTPTNAVDLGLTRLGDSSLSFDGHIKEVLLSDSSDWNALGERAALYGYLINKWGTP